MGPPILLTNDDGYDAEGLAALWKTVAAVWDTPVRVVAPKTCGSQLSHATITKKPIRVEAIDHPRMEGYVADAYPADCVRLGLRGLDLFDGALPLVFAGINPGANLGIDAFYSGTVAAAREAVAFGCPGVAVSQIVRPGTTPNWETTIAWATETLLRLRPGIEAGGATIWNVNFPKSEQEDLPPIRVVPISTDPLDVSYESPEGGIGDFAFSGNYFNRPARPGTDVAELLAGNVTVTPMGLDCTRDDLLD